MFQHGPHPEDVMVVIKKATETAMMTIRVMDEIAYAMSHAGDPDILAYANANVAGYAKTMLDAARDADYYARGVWHYWEVPCPERNGMPFPCERCGQHSVAARFCEACAPLAAQKLPTGTKVRTKVEVVLEPANNKMPAGTEGVVVEDLNEVVAKENAALRPGARTDDRPRYLALVKFENGRQQWMWYPELEKVENNHG